MTQQEWLADTQRRIAINEGSRNTMYYDSVGIPTIGIGFNLQRSDARDALQRAGVAAQDVDAVMKGQKPLTDAQVSALFAYSFAPILSEARASLDSGIYDSLSDARRFVVADLVYNLGAAGWSSFVTTRSLINKAQSLKAQNSGPAAATAFGDVADHMKASLWYQQTGNRARRDCAMMRRSVYCDPTGDGSDIGG